MKRFFGILFAVVICLSYHFVMIAEAADLSQTNATVQITGKTQNTIDTDTAVVAGLLGNPNCMSYGPGNLAQAHKPDEYVEIADIERCVQVYRELICLYEDML